MALTQTRLKELLDYDPETGVFTWKKRTSNRVRIGSVAGYAGPDGYCDVRIDGCLYAAHRLVWLYVRGKFPAHEIDHRNRCPSDNRLKNLRESTHVENSHNRGVHHDNEHGHLGVTWSKGACKWQASIYAHGKHHYLGLFTDIAIASAAYQAAKLIHHPTVPTDH